MRLQSATPRFTFDLAFARSRRSTVVDGCIAFTSGLCVGNPWTGDPAKGKAPRCDTGVESKGSAVADVARRFADVWSATGEQLPTSDTPIRDALPQAGDVRLRVVPAVPSSTGLYRLDQLIAASARHTLWLTDAYFAGTISYMQELCETTQDGVDVRPLTPGSSDVPTVQAISRASYRPLLHTDARVFEWNGPTTHAKSADLDSRWARIGSTNLNITSWIGNCELDVVVEDEDIARKVAGYVRADLHTTTEIVLGKRNKVRGCRRQKTSRR